MALIIRDSEKISFNGLSFTQTGELLLEHSPSGDGKGITLILTRTEEAVFESYGGTRIGYSIVDLIADAVERKTGIRPKDLNYTYDLLAHTFTT